MSDKYKRRDKKRFKARYGHTMDNKNLKQIQLDLYYGKLREQEDHVTTETTDEEVNQSAQMATI